MPQTYTGLIRGLCSGLKNERAGPYADSLVTATETNPDVFRSLKLPGGTAHLEMR